MRTGSLQADRKRSAPTEATDSGTAPALARSPF